MPAISITLGTKYAFNLSFARDHIQYGVSRCSKKFRDCSLEFAGIYSPQQIRLQTYNVMVPIKTEIADIFGPLFNNDYRFIRSLIESRFVTKIAGIYGSYNMVPIWTDIAGIFGLYLDRYCRHNRSPRYRLLFIIN